MLSPQNEYIDWRKFLLVAAQPWSKPTTEQLLAMKSQFKEIDVAGNGWITKDQYNEVGDEVGHKTFKCISSLRML